MGGGSARAGLASKRWLLTWSSLTPVLPAVREGRGQNRQLLIPPAELLPVECFAPCRFVAFSRCPLGNTRWGVKARTRLHPVGGWVGEDLECGTHTKPPNKGPGRWKALITRQNSSRLGRKRSYVHKFKPKTDEQNPSRTILPIPSASADPTASANAANPCHSLPLFSGTPCTFGIWFYQNPRTGVWTSPSTERPPCEQSTATAKGFFFPGRKERLWEEASCCPVPQNEQKPK